MQKIKTSVPNSTKSFNSLINHLSSHGSHHEVLSKFSSMLNTKVPLDPFTFPSLFKACASLKFFSLGISIHHRVIVEGCSSDPYISSSLINFYAKFGRLEVARNVFDEMLVRDIVHWTAMIGCYSRTGDADGMFSLFRGMRYQEIEPSPVTFLEMLGGVSDIAQLQCLHGLSVLYGFSRDISVVNSMVNVYCKCGDVKDAKDLFEQMNQRDIVSWNSMISGYAHIGNVKEMLQLLCGMMDECVKPNQQTFGSAMSALATSDYLEIGRVLHGQIVRAGFNFDTHLKTSLLAMYLKCQDVEAAFWIFESIPDKDVICWTAMISGLWQNDCTKKALKVFSDMLKSGLEPSTETIASILAACAQLGSFDLGASVHGYVLRQGMILDTPALNSLITMYAKCGRLEQSLSVFVRMNERDQVSCNAIISGYAQNGNLNKALILFNEMKSKTLQRPDSLTVVSLLQACASIGALHDGKLIHNFVIRSSIMPGILVDTALVDMYAKCGCLETAQKCFDAILLKDLVSWSTIIAGYGFHGRGHTALRVYSEFLRSSIKMPNHVIFLSILSSCSHNGLVQQGLCIFNSMTNKFGLEPRHDHLACIVDLLCRARKVNEAYEFYKEKFSEPSIDVLGMVLDACRANGNMKLVEIISWDMIKLKPVKAEIYVQLAHCYASMNRWDGVGETWHRMRSLGLKKLPGWSFIEISGKITTFFMDHNSHPLFEEIVFALKILSMEMGTMDHQYQIHDSS